MRTNVGQREEGKREEGQIILKKTITSSIVVTMNCIPGLTMIDGREIKRDINK
jgi:Ca2+/H+ antiporter